MDLGCVMLIVAALSVVLMCVACCVSWFRPYCACYVSRACRELFCPVFIHSRATYVLCGSDVLWCCF